MSNIKLKYYFILIILCLITSQLFSQLDSLYTKINEAEGDEKFELLLSISKDYWFIDPIKSVEYAKEALDLGDKLKNDIKKSRAFNRIANGYYFLEEYKLSLEYYKKSLDLSELIEYPTGIAKASNNIGLIYRVLGDYDMAVHYYHQSLELEKKANNKDGIATSSLNLGNIYFYLSEFDKAIELFNQCLTIYIENDDKSGKLDVYNNIGSTYTELEFYDSALYYISMAYQLSIELNDLDQKATTLNNLGIIYFDKGDYEKAIDHYQQALEISVKDEDLWSESNTLRNIGGVYFTKQEYKKAFSYFEEARKIAEKINARPLLMDLYSNISDYYEATKDYQTALEYYELAATLNDTIYNEESRRQIAEIEAQYAFRNKDQQLELITKENEVKNLKIKTQRYIIYVIASIGVFILTLVFVFYGRSRINKKGRIQLEEKNIRITEQKILLEKTVSELKESEEKQRSLVENILDGIFIIQSNRLVYINEAIVKITGYSVSEMHNMKFEDIIAPRDLIKIENSFKNHLEGNDLRSSYEFGIKHKSGKIIHVMISVGNISYHGEVAIIGTLKDITQQKKHEDELIKEKEKAESATQSKSMFLAGMSHEIRNHMNSIIGITEVLSETKLSKEQSEYINVINVSSNNLLNIINKILDFSKIEAGQVVLDSKEFILAELINEVTSMHEIRAKQSNLKLELEIDKKIPKTLIGDPTRISQILINLVSNALKFTDKGGVTIKVTNADSMSTNTDHLDLRFSIQDTGIGISKDSQNKLFKPFSQTHVAVQRKLGGTGLGLAISKQLVELMQGEIGVESKVNDGSTFWFAIQLSKSGQTKIDKSYKEQNKNTENPRILLVEDNILNQQLTANILVKEGYKTDIAENGQIGFDFFLKNTYDVILMDIQMPVMDGIQATRLIREYESKNNRSKTKIIAVTAHTRDGEKQQLINAGIDLYLSKPFKSNELLDMINELIKV